MAGLISPATLEQIRGASDIVDIIGGYIPLKRAGANFTALCPFHKEKSPSFNVNPHKQIFHCFGCHKGGDVFTFVKDYENIGFLDAVRRLAERAKIPLEFDQNPAAQESRHIKDQLLQIHEQIAQRWQNCLANEAAGQLARDYLKKRGVGEDAIKLFRIGAAPEAWDDTVNWAKSKSHPLELVEKAGLVIRKEETGNYYDRFRGRLMFPICDEQGRVIGFSGRILTGDEKTAKYVNSPETPIFTKGKIFFGLDKAKRAMLDEEEAIICEGQLDLIACHMAGVKNVIAPQGTALTADHARILARYVSLVAVCFDADSAGWNAAIRSLDPLLSANIAVLIVTIPPPHDPDSFIKEHGASGFKKLVAEAPGFFEFYLDRLCKINDPASDRGRVAIVQAMGESLQKTDSPVQFDLHAQKTALRLGVSSDAVRAAFKKFAGTKSTGPTIDDIPAEESVAETPPPSLQENWLLKIVLLQDEYIPWVALHLDLKWIQHPHVREIVEQRLKAQAEGNWQSLAAFLRGCENENARQLITEAINAKYPILKPELVLKGDPSLQDPRGLLNILRDEFIECELFKLKQKLADPSISDHENLALLQYQKELQQLKRQPLAANAG